METKILTLDDVLLHLDSIHPFPPGLADHFRSIIRVKTFKKKKLLLSPPAICRYLYFVKKGLLRSFYLKDDGSEVTNGLYTEMEFVVSVHSFYTGLPSAEFIQALEDTEVYSISKEELDDIYTDYPEFRENGRLLTIKYLVDYSLQMQLIRAMSAQEKIQALREKYEKLLNRVPQKYLASYVDIIPETFSKLKNNRKY